MLRTYSLQNFKIQKWDLTPPYYIIFRMKTRCQCQDDICDWSVPNLRCLLEPRETTTFEPTTTAVPETECPVLTDDHGDWECENENFHKSVCMLSCHDRFEQVRTVRKCLCKDGICNWERPMRSCMSEALFIPVTKPPVQGGICVALQEDPVGKWRCSMGEFVGSRCKLECDAGFVSNTKHNARRCRCSARQDVSFVKSCYH